MKSNLNLITGIFKSPGPGLFLLILLPLSSTLNAQEGLTLKDCYELAITNSALAGEQKTYSEISGLKERNLSKGWLPTIDANGSFIYNSEVIDMSSVLGALPFPGIADAIQPLPHEQYKINLEINQVIYDGGFIKNSRVRERTGLRITEKQTEADLYKLRAQVNSYFFGILLADRQKELLLSYRELIAKRISSVQSAVENGVVLKSDLDILTGEKLKADQQLAEIEIRKSSLLKIMSDLTGQNIDRSSKLILPEIQGEMTDEIERPEIQLFDLRKDEAAAGISLIESRRRPKAYGFATAGYGNPPGNNFFRDEFAPYYIVGAGIKWNILDWNKAKNEKKVIAHQQTIIENRKEDLTKTLKRSLEAKKAEIRSLDSMIGTDTLLISIRKKISASAESRYENGTITASEYLNEMNSEHQAMINYEIHKINLLMARIEYLNISGKETE